MRPIDADAFNEKYGNYYAEEGPEEGFIGTVGQLIDNAPTIEFDIERAYKDIRLLEKCNERPKGEWITNEQHNTVCSICGGIRRDNRFDHIDFCNKCGADMRGDE